MIRFLIALECVLLVIVIIGRWFSLDPTPTLSNDPARRAIHRAVDQNDGLSIDGAARASASAQPIGANDRIAIARDLLRPHLTTNAGWDSSEATTAIAIADTAAGDGGTVDNDAAGGEALVGPVATATNNPMATIVRRLERSTFAEAVVPRPSARPAMIDANPPAKPGALPSAKGSPPRPTELTGAAAATETVQAQRLLALLGYRPGAADGVLGGRTETAIRAFQLRAGMRVDGQVSDALLGNLRSAARQAVARRGTDRQAAAAHAGGSGGAMPRWLGTIAGGFQRLIGRDFDSVARPDDLRSYCRQQPDNWVYDEGRSTFVYCEQIASRGRR
jgi:Putative peptidoglycan binding domain